MSMMFRHVALIVVYLLELALCVERLEFSDIIQRTNSTCFVVGIPSVSRAGRGETDVLNAQMIVAGDNLTAEEGLKHIQYSFREESSIEIGWISLSDLEKLSTVSGLPGRKKVWAFQDEHGADIEVERIAAIPTTKIDRTCLLESPANVKPTIEMYSGTNSVDLLVEFVNSVCDVFRSPHGHLLPGGIHRRHILGNLFQVKTVSNLSMGDVYKTVNNPLNTSFCWECDSDGEKEPSPSRANDVCTHGSCVESNIKIGRHYEPVIPKCERISLPTKDEFFHEYLKKSRPVVIANGTAHWPAMKRWTMEFFKQEYGNKDVHIKLAPRGNFEGVEPASSWENYGAFKMPDFVRSKLSYPELVVVRPAYLNMNMSEFIDVIQNRSYLQENISAYLEYSSIPEYLPKLEQDIEEFEFVKGMLKRKHLNIWLSNGNTLGKLHFDQFDNLLCQLSGKKEVIMFEPFNSSQLYEGHIPEAMLSFNKKTRQFRRKTLKDSTSMVMSPVDLMEPDFEKFPNFRHALPYNCTISEGDVLFMPAFWWHEVNSRPSPDGRNLAVNYWYEPFLTKEFPCRECPMDVNVKEYRHML